MYIQIKDLRFEDNAFSYESNETEVITLQCSLLTLQMLDYDIMMFKAMSDEEDKEYGEAAKGIIALIFLAMLLKLIKINIENCGSCRKNFWEWRKNFYLEKMSSHHMPEWYAHLILIKAYCIFL